MLKVVINDKFGGYGLSGRALKLIYERNPASAALVVYANQADSEFARYPVEEWQSFLKAHCVPVGGGVYVCASRDSRVSVRSDATLVGVVEELGALANASHAKLKVVQVEDEWVSIREDDGLESISR